jgi:hypothetical protein
MTDVVVASPRPPQQSRPRRNFYKGVLRALLQHDVPCLVGGTFALEAHTGIRRATKDLDLFIRRDDWHRAARALSLSGITASLTFPHWLGKATSGRHSADRLFCSGNGLCPVDDSWFAAPLQVRVSGVPAQLCHAEELIWSKSFVQERERFDGADVLHLIRARADTLDWDRLLYRFGPNWEVLLSHLVLFGFVFPADRHRVPGEIMRLLLSQVSVPPPAPPVPLCRGTLLSREQYLVDVEQGGDLDARLAPYGPLAPDDLVEWTAQIPMARRAILTTHARGTRPVRA